MFEYPVKLTPAEEGGFVVTFPDIPEAITQSEDEEDGLLRAKDVLETALAMYVEESRNLPTPSPDKDGVTVAPGVMQCAKLGIYQAMRGQGIRKTELARRLHWHMPQVDRLLDLGHASRFSQVERAISALGRRIELQMF